jgi:ketosteroid isomerase-like protein
LPKDLGRGSGAICRRRGSPQDQRPVA